MLHQHFMMHHVLIENHRIMQQMHNQAIYTGQMKYPDFRSKYKEVPRVILKETPYKESPRLIQARLNYVPQPLPNTRRRGSDTSLPDARFLVKKKFLCEIILSCGGILVLVIITFLFGYYMSL